VQWNKDEGGYQAGIFNNPKYKRSAEARAAAARPPPQTAAEVKPRMTA
jgi:hypothetical protein